MTLLDTIAEATGLPVFFPDTLPLTLPVAAPGAPVLQPGERWRFAVELGSCIGCHACEVACGEQNGLPAELQWRRVGDVEIGAFPATRLHVSMACNHCVEPTCLQGCPANAYEKLSSGIVIHLDDECIGCTYCTWTCAYQAPVFQPDRRIVTKCDMCHVRLEEGRSTACAEACPTGAIRVERVHEDVVTAIGGLDAAFLPPSTISQSTTEWIVPEHLQDALARGDFRAADDHQPTPEPSHWPLVVVTVASQLTAGLAGAALGTGSRSLVVATGVVSVLGSSASLAHLGRPMHAWKAFRNVRRSWLSREAVLFATHAGLSGLLATVAVLGLSVPHAVLAVSLLLAVAGVYASSRVYRLPARPAWDSRWTTAQFAATAVACGAVAVLLASPSGASTAVAVGGLAGAMATSAARRARLLRAGGPAVHPAIARAMERSAQVLTEQCGTDERLRWTLAALGLVLLLVAPLAGAGVLLAAEVVDRRTFYRSSLPLDMAGRFSGWRRAHA